MDTGVEILSVSANLGKGIRILNQDAVETLFSFIISQNNNIPRIKKSIEKLCQGLGEEKEFEGIKYYAFPTVEKMSQAPLEFYKEIGLGYRAEYVKKLAEKIVQGFSVNSLKALATNELKSVLTSLYGVGPKVADCVSLFGFHRSDSFPVDTWIDKVYKEHFNGSLTDRNKISKWFTDLFKENSGYYQQYLFYYKRSLEKQN
jgi:N-glycosylase/DNA lyase